MKYILLLPAFSNADNPFNKLPDTVVNKLSNVIDSACENAKHKLDNNEARQVFAEKMNVICHDVADMFKGFFPEKKNILDLCYFASAASQGGYFQEDGHAEPAEINEARNYRRSIEAAGLLTKTVLDNVYTFSYSKCKGETLPDDHDMKWTHQQKSANAISLITAPLILKDVDVHRGGKRSAMTNNDEFGATQYLENWSSVEQSVTIQKDIEKKSTHLQSNTKGWSYEVGFSLTVSAEFGVKGLYDVEVSATASTNYGESGESTKEDSTENTITEAFTFNLNVPPCHALTGRVVVQRQTEEYNLTQTFEIDERKVHIDGKIVERNAIHQNFIIEEIRKLNGCGLDEKNEEDDCNEHDIDLAFENIIPRGEFDWRCVDLQRRRVCTAICKSGQHKSQKAYKIQCPHNTTYWTKTDNNQHAIDCNQDHHSFITAPFKLV